MYEEPIRFVETRSITRDIVSNDVFTFRPDKRWVLIQKLCLAILKKLGCFYQQTVQIGQIKKVLNNRPFISHLLEQKEQLAEHFGYYHPTRLLIGASDYADLMQSDEALTLIDFRTAYSSGSKGILGLDVTIVPWMKGYIVLP